VVWVVLQVFWPVNPNQEREEHRLRVFENKVLRRIFGPRRDEVTGGGLNNEELHNLYISPCIIGMIKLRLMRYHGHVARMGKKKKNAS
jgi:hypothetical protein